MHRAGAHPGGRPCGRPHRCIAGDTGAPRPGNSGRRRRNSSGTPPGSTTYEAIHTLRAQGTSVTTIAAAARDQPSHRVRVPAADPAPESAQPAAVRPGVAAVHGVSDPALAGGVHGQHAALARDCGRWAMRTPPGRSRVSSPGCGGRAPRAGRPRRRPRPTPARRGRRPGPSRSPGCAPKRSGRRTRSCMSTN